MMSVSDVCLALSTLVSNPKCDRSDLDSALMSNLHKLASSSSEGSHIVLPRVSSQLTTLISSSSPSSEKYVSTCLLLLTCLRDELLCLREGDKHTTNKTSVPRLPSDALSVLQQQTIARTLQFITALGIYPYLQSGVGIPLPLRMKQSHLLGLTGLQYESEAGGDEEKSMNRLVETILTLAKCLDHPNLRSIVLSKHLTDMLASFLQVCHSPTYKDALDMSKKEECIEVLRNLMDRTYQPLIIRELLVLQGQPPRASQKMSKDGSESSSSTKMMSAVVAPKWLRNVCGNYLSERLMRDEGVHAVILAITDIPGLSSDMLWKRCESVAQLLANCPRQAESVEEYYKKICPQILDLLIQSKQDSVNLAFLQIAVATVSAVYERNRPLAEQLLLWPITKPLLYMIKDSQFLSACGASVLGGNQWVLASEDQVTNCIEMLHKMLVCCNGLRSNVVHALSVVVPAMVRVRCAAMRSVSHLRTLTQEVLDSFMKKADSKVAVTLLCQALLPYNVFISETAASHVTSSIAIFHSDVVLVRGRSGGVMVVDSSSQCEQLEVPDLIERNFQIECNCLVDMVKDPSSGLTFLEILFEELSALLCSQQVKRNDQSLLAFEENITEGSRRQHALILMNYIAALCENLNEQVVSQPAPLLGFLVASFSQSMHELVVSQEAGIACETLTLALGLTSALLGTKQKNLKQHRSQLMSLQPHLEVLSKRHPDPDTREILCDLHICIATHGAVWSETPQQYKQGKAVSRDGDATEGSFRNAMEELLDPLLPVRAHALRQLTSLIQSKDPEAISHSQKLLLIFRQQLEHSDSYIYLAAINGLVALGDKFPDQVVDTLCREFALFYGSQTNDVECKSMGLTKPVVPAQVKPELTLDLRLKLGEAIVKLSEALGDMLPHYRGPLLSALMSSVKDSDELVRASSLSNLAIVCKQLRFGIGTVLHEVLSCVTAVVSHDLSAKVRRAAILVLEMMFKGLGNACLKVMGDRLQEVYRLLKHIQSSDCDDPTQTQAGAALGELETIMRQSLFPSQELKKKITVLDSL